MAIGVAAYRRILKTHGKEAADRANAADTTEVGTPPSRPPTRAVVRTPARIIPAEPPPAGLTEVQARFVRIAAFVQKELGCPPSKSHLEAICGALHFGTHFFRAMAEIERSGTIRREDDGTVVRYRVNRPLTDPLAGPDRAIANAVLRPPP